MATTQVPPYANEINQNAGMAKLVDALDLGSCGATRKSSTLFTRTIRLCRWQSRDRRLK